MMTSTKEKKLSKLALINLLKRVTPNVRCQIIDFLNPRGIQVLSESVFNVLFNDAPLKKSQKRRLRIKCLKDKKILMEISKRSASLKKKKKLLKQTGDGLGTSLGEKSQTFYK